jgi:hypothetical protein
MMMMCAIGAARNVSAIPLSRNTSPMQAPSNPLDRAGALLWLNDRLGERVNLNVSIDVGDYPASVLSASGVLRHWRQACASGELRPVHRTILAIGAASEEELSGSYEVGTVALDLSDDLPCEFWVCNGEIDQLGGVDQLIARIGDVQVAVTRPTMQLPGGDA